MLKVGTNLNPWDGRNLRQNMQTCAYTEIENFESFGLWKQSKRKEEGVSREVEGKTQKGDGSIS